MTVKELLEKLQVMDQDSEILVWDFGYGGLISVHEIWVTEDSRGLVLEGKGQERER